MLVGEFDYGALRAIAVARPSGHAVWSIVQHVAVTDDEFAARFIGGDDVSIRGANLPVRLSGERELSGMPAMKKRRAKKRHAAAQSRPARRSRKKNPAPGFEVRMGVYPRSAGDTVTREKNREHLKLVWTAGTLEDAKFIARTYAKENPRLMVTVDKA